MQIEWLDPGGFYFCQTDRDDVRVRERLFYRDRRTYIHIWHCVTAHPIHLHHMRNV
jgi:hypothetical protein